MNRAFPFFILVCLAIVLLVIDTQVTSNSKETLVLDRTTGSGISMVLNNSATPEKHLIETMTGGVAVFDYDNDGYPDIYFVNGASQPALEKSGPSFFNRLYRNKGNWNFEDVTERAGLQGKGYSMAVSAGDFDNDGFADLFVSSVTGGQLFRNKGNGTFEDVTAQAKIASLGWSVGAAWLDYDNDGYLDLFVVRYVKWDPHHEPFCGEEASKIRTYCHPRFYAPLSNQLFHNNRDGTFTDVSNASGIGSYGGKGMAATAGDYDHDGRLDIFVANDTLPNFLFHNEGAGRFREVGLQAGVAYNDDGVAISSMGSVFKDLDNDGQEDIVVTALLNETFPFFRNTGKGIFLDQSYASGLARITKGLSGWGVGVVDWNNDGWKDLLIANGDVQSNTESYSSRKSKQQNILLLNSQKNGFQGQLVSEIAMHRGAAFGDFDRDGRVDAVVTRLNQTPILLQNVSSPANHWINIRLIGHQSNRDGIGARITIRSGSFTEVERCMPSSGYASSSEPMVHFGLRDHKRIDRIEIEWPSGIQQVLSSQEVDRFIPVEEPITNN